MATEAMMGLDVQDSLVNFIEHRVMRVTDEEFSRSRMCARNALMALGTGVIVATTIPTTIKCLSASALILDLPEGDSRTLALGIPAAAGSVFSDCFFSANALLEFLHQLLLPVNEREQRELFENFVPKWKRTAALVFSMIIGILNQVPDSWDAYNSTDSILPPLVGLFLVLLNFPPQSLSTFNSLMGISRPQKWLYVQAIERQLDRSRENLFFRIKACRKALKENTPARTAFLDFVDQMKTIEEIGCPQYLEAIVRFQTNEDGRSPPLSPGTQTAILLSAFPMVFSWLALMGAATEEAASTLVPDDKAFSYSAAALTVAATTHLLWSLVTSSMKSLVHLWNRTHKPRVTEMAHPRFHKISTYGGKILSLFSIVPTIAGAKKFFPEFYPEVAVCASAGSTLGIMASVDSLTKRVVNLFSRETLVFADQQLKALSETIEHAKLDRYAEFLLALNDDTRAALRGQNLTDNQLRAFSQ